MDMLFRGEAVSTELIKQAQDLSETHIRNLCAHLKADCCVAGFGCLQHTTGLIYHAHTDVLPWRRVGVQEMINCRPMAVLECGSQDLIGLYLTFALMQKIELTLDTPSRTMFLLGCTGTMFKLPGIESLVWAGTVEGLFT